MKTLNEMKRFATLLTASALLLLGACTGNSDKGGQTDSTAVTVDSTDVADDGVKVVRGEVVDGSRRNIYVQVGDSTYSFELDPSMEDVQYEIGESLTVRYITTSDGDSVIDVQNSDVY